MKRKCLNRFGSRSHTLALHYSNQLVSLILILSVMQSRKCSVHAKHPSANPHQSDLAPLKLLYIALIRPHTISARMWITYSHISSIAFKHIHIFISRLTQFHRLGCPTPFTLWVFHRNSESTVLVLLLANTCYNRTNLSPL